MAEKELTCNGRIRTNTDIFSSIFLLIDKKEFFYYTFAQLLLLL